ncbi:hypothetical protein A3A46_01000 [Candidatus Roizmanbacteria bacterium RIFCSPLOWO2_01_FULL_37_13]|uniref:Uncharacterized protein n=1 Tax=Candidatus Roizmanbacteria bacterium RIFCSPHIGHO2_02_FULL_38_11 TaxID=1802039 RepID=A0A1F7GYF8_9BACT|nr:MAG: hypothetical protein A3C25_05460 [Candidatus Roizmanbacteria bacterium RIFCSPHIGHO2_02_FULL_38_11]OGK41265.1 MAG: hypothetical protein A3A46_01000 [Candidatus Roizmanbacteria bacterium RIFCSPLOWO2_01_FULL_37_13]
MQIMQIKRFFLYIGFILVTIFFLRFAASVWAANPVPGFRLNLLVSQPSDLTLIFGNIGLEEGPYVSYGINYPDNYYLIKIVDKSNTELFVGKTPRTYQTLAPDFVPFTSFTPETILADPITMYLPYFNEAAKIQLFDENNTLKLEVVLADYNLQGLKPRFIFCDLCGYCQGQKPPSTWEKCRQCLYPAANPTPTIGDTLRISDSGSNTGPTPYPSKAFTGIGCINANQAALSQTLLNIIFSISGGIAFLYFLYGAFIITTSQDDAEKLNYGRRLVYGAIVGLILTLSSFLIVNFIASGVLRLPGFSKP